MLTTIIECIRDALTDSSDADCEIVLGCVHAFGLKTYPKNTQVEYCSGIATKKDHAVCVTGCRMG